TDVSWLTLAADTRGQGTATLAFQVAANPDARERRGHVIVNDARLELTQAGAACAFALDAAAGSVGTEGGSLRVQVSAADGCRWTAASQAPWLRVASGGAGEGPGSVAVEVEPNGGEPRTGTVTIAGLPFTVAQGAAAPEPPAGGCALTVLPTSVTLPASGGATAGSLAGDASCAWTDRK